MRIRRSRMTGDFLQVPNATVRDDRLSHMARGILVELLSRPDGWETTADDTWRASTAKRGKESPGRRQFRAAFAELKQYGYLTPHRELQSGGRHTTILTITDVPHAGTSAPPAETRNAAGHTDVPHGGTPETGTDVPPAGTPVPPAETGVFAGRTDVPLSDVPHGGTSKEEDGEKNTGKNTSSSTALARRDDEDLSAFGHFWVVHPKSRDRNRTLAAWREAVAAGTDPTQIIEAAKAYARERAGEDLHFTKLSHTWLRDGRYHDRYAPEPTPDGRPALRAVSSGDYPPLRDRAQQQTDDWFERSMQRAQARDAQEGTL